MPGNQGLIPIYFIPSIRIAIMKITLFYNEYPYTDMTFLYWDVHQDKSLTELLCNSYI